jgi:VWFA-related protein
VAVGLAWLVSTPLAQQEQATSTAQQPDRQGPPVTFKVDVSYVEMDAVAVDSGGTFVRDLKKEDFQVLEDGKPQAITAFGLVDIPLARIEAPLFMKRAIEPDVQTNEEGYDGRIYVLVLDDLHTAFERTPRVKAAARRFVEQTLSDNDVAAVLFTGGGNGGQDFTKNRRLLLNAIDRFMGRKLRSATLNRIDQYNRTAGQTTSNSIKDPEEQERAFNARTALDHLRRVSDYLGGIHGRRKALVFISEGIDYDITDPINNTEASTLIDGVRDLIAAATRANVNVYSLDPRGLTDMGSEMMDMQNIVEDPSMGLTPEAMLAELRLSQDSLRTVSEQTGGFAAVNANDLRAAFDRIRSENSSYYVIGYYPTAERRDGKFHAVQVKTTRPGVVIHTRKGYLAPKGRAAAAKPVEATPGTSAELHEALDSPLPVSGIPLDATVACLKGNPPNAAVVVTVQVPTGALRFPAQDTAEDHLEMVVLAVDHDGKIRDGQRQEITIPAKAEAHTMLTRVGLRMITRLKLPPGRYQVRAALHDSLSRTIGSVYSDVEVPDFGKEPFSMSGLFLTSARTAIIATPKPDEELKTMMPAPPPTFREFSNGDELSVLAEVYDNLGSAPHAVDIRTTVQGDDGRVLFKHEEQRSNSEIGGARGGYGYTARIPLKDLAPGLYLLRVEAHSHLGRELTVSRETQIRVLAMK